MKNRIAGFLDTGAGRKGRNALIFGILLAAFYLWFQNILLALIISACAFIYITDLFSSRKRRQLDILHRQLLSFLEHMIIMLRAGKTIRQVLLGSWSHFPAPLGTCLKQVAQRLEIDPDLEKALDIFEEKCGSREAALIAAGIKINSRVGGDIIILLQSLSATLRQSRRSRSRLENLTIQSRFSADIIGSFPAFALMFMYFFFSRGVTGFFSTAAGTMVLIIGGILQIAGILFMKRIIRGN